MAKSNADIAKDVRTGGNLPGGYAFNPSKPDGEQVRKLTAEEEQALAQGASLPDDDAQPSSGGPNVSRD